MKFVKLIKKRVLFLCSMNLYKRHVVNVTKSQHICIYMCVRLYVCVYVCMDNINVWVSCKKSQPKMCLVYQVQNCLFLRKGTTSNLNLLFYYHNYFFLIVSQNICSYVKKKCFSNLAVVYLESFQGRYTGLGTQLCIQFMKIS